MFLSSVNLNELIQQLNSNNRPINLFEILSLLEAQTNIVLDGEWCLFKENNDKAIFNQIIQDHGPNINLQNALNYLLESESVYSNLISDYLVKYRGSSNRGNNILGQYGYNLLSLKEETCLHREQEQELIKICLTRNYKNNVMLIGSSGVGKTFLISSIARLMNLDIYYVDISSILSGSKYRGEFEKKFHTLLNEALKSKTTLFFDEAHTILNTGNSDGGISGADILKPYLMNSDFRMIGATTIDEAEAFTKDKAFSRRFNFLKLEELPIEKTKDIIKRKYTQTLNWDQKTFNKIFTYLDSVFLNRNYPDKALDFFDFYFSGER
ncbi:TPA: AAA family ATPase, partial [Legionella pneumophila]